jgi:hypothetical protein
MRKIRGKDLYKVWNTATGEIKSSGSTKADAKSQVRLLRGLEKKEAGSLKADQIKEVLDLSYNNKKEGAPDGYVIDKDLSDGRVKVYKDLNSNQVIVAHRGSSGWKDWLDNAYYATTGNIKDSGTYKTHKKKHDKALDKYGAENVISVGHSRAGKYVEELNKDNKVKEVLTYNKAVGLHDAFQKNPENQTDIRSSRDLISGLSPFQSSKNKVVTIPSNTFNFLKAHGTSALSSLGNKLIGKGLKGGRFNPKGLRVGEMRKFVKAFKKEKYGENWIGGAKYGKKELAELIKPMLEDDDIDELVGGSIWTDFVKEFSAKHSLKYACALSKYKEQLKKAYKLFKEKKEWYEPMKIDAISEASIQPENITMTITEPTPEPVIIPTTKKVLPPIISEKESALLQMKKAELLAIFENAGANMKGLKTMKHGDLVDKLLEIAKIPKGVRYFDKPKGMYIYNSLKDAYRCLDDDSYGGYRHVKYELMQREKQLEIEKARKGADRNIEEIEYLQNGIDENKKRISECDALMERDFQKEYEGAGILSGGNKWTDFVKDYAKSYNTTYGCALSDVGIKGAYKLFKDGKTWYFPKVSATIETQTEPEFIEPEPVKAPENIEPTINRIEEKVKELERLGASKGAVSYNSATLITDIAFVNLLKKYGGKCVVNNVMSAKGVELGININNNRSNSEIFNRDKTLILAQKLQDCIKRGVKLICIPLSLQFGKSATGHANMLVYRPFKRIVERFEPHGQAFGNSMADNSSFNKQLRDLWEEVLKPYIGDVRFVEPDEICPNPRGFQALEGQLRSLGAEGGGFCSMWSFFLAEMTFINPDKSTKEIIEEVFEISAKEPAYLKSVIRGYVIEVENGLDELLKVMGKSGFSFKGTGMNSPYIKVAGSAGEFEAWILSVSFDSGKYSEAPPQYEPLPDVRIKGKSDEDKLKETFANKIKGLTKDQVNNIYGVYGLKGKTGKKDDIINLLINALFDGRLSKWGATGLEDLDIILEEELYKRGDTAPKDYFIKKRDEREADIASKIEGGYFKIGSRSFGKKHGGKFDLGKSLTKGAFAVSQGLNKINPMMIALNNPKSRKVMSQSGELTNDYLLPAVVSAGKPVYDGTAMGASTLLTGNPLLGKALADSLWDNMVANKGIDPRDRQKSEELGNFSGAIGNVLGKASGKM